MANETITIREYARRRNCSDTAVHKAITSGKIKQGVIHEPGKKWPRIDPEIADQEWVQNFNVKKSQNLEMAASIFKEVTQEPGPGFPPEKRPEPLPRESSGKTLDPPQERPAPKQPDGDLTMAQAQKARAIFEAKIKELEYKEKLGMLIDKGKVYRNLFAFGQEIRSAFQALPDRIIDDLLAQPTRNQSHAMLYNAIADVLENLSRTPELGR